MMIGEDGFSAVLKSSDLTPFIERQLLDVLFLIHGREYC